ncbi:hypothetical protein [Aliikangiella sp. IMCC44359]|uniref:hypothetical protein n=1 Tax=Aliikangiella sp. IMCC44359 TaxID=3459125 RepID=UPI00403B3032
MNYFLFDKEKSLEDIVNTAYKGLTASARKDAEALLIKANPQLKKSIKNIRKGSIIRVPAFRSKDKRNRKASDDPIETVALDLSKKLRVFEDVLSDKFSEVDKKIKREAALLKSATKELKTKPNGEELAKSLSKHLKESKEINAKKKKVSLDALEVLQKIADSVER